MSWTFHNYLAPLAVAVWLIGSYLALIHKPQKAGLFVLAGSLLTLVFIVGLWFKLGRPPLRTMGETRLWYSFFLSLAGLLAYARWKYPWLLVFSAVVASVFAVINVLKPELHSKALMPALISPYFVPHVTAYMLSYAVLAASALGAVVQFKMLIKSGKSDRKLYSFIDDTVGIGLGFLMLGLITGALWAKEAWGHYWSWDPKETWALITMAAFLGYLHFRLNPPRGFGEYAGLLLPPAGLIILLFTWLGVSLLPSAAGSVHVY
jgi:ABC-type transport system involved in cytochrome c biogenesis permease subunit